MNINTEKEYSNARFNRKELKACAKERLSRTMFCL